MIANKTLFSIQPKKHIHYDILIVGGGLVGLSASLALQHAFRAEGKNTIKMAIIESFPFPKTSKMQQARSPYIALSYGSSLVYQQWGIWGKISPSVEPIYSIHTSHQKSFGKAFLHAKDYALPFLGGVISKNILLKILIDEINDQKNSNITMYCPMSIDSFDFTSKTPKMLIKNEKEHLLLSSELIICANGSSNDIEKLGFTTQCIHYQQTAILTEIKHTQHHHGMAFERFTPESFIACLPMKSGYQSSLIWTMAPAKAAQYTQCKDNHFLLEFMSHFGSRLGQFCKISQRKQVPLALKTVCHPIKENILLLGNSAHNLHPIGGQGYNLSLRDCQALASVLAIHPSSSFGQPSLLQKYVEAQTDDQQATIAITHLLATLFHKKNPLISWGITPSFMLLNFLMPLKKWLGRRMMGLQG